MSNESKSPQQGTRKTTAFILEVCCPEDSWSGGLPGCCRSVPHHGHEPVTVKFTSLKGCIKHGCVEQALYSHGNQGNSFCFCLFHPTTLPRLALISALVTTRHLQKHPQETLGEDKKKWNNLNPVLNYKVIFPQQRANRILHNAQNECPQKSIFPAGCTN